MTKAILELPKMPNSCMECPLYKITGICDILSAWNNFMPVFVPSEGRHPDCPLKEVKENKEKDDDFKKVLSDYTYPVIMKVQKENIEKECKK